MNIEISVDEILMAVPSLLPYRLRGYVCTYIRILVNRMGGTAAWTTYSRELQQLNAAR